MNDYEYYEKARSRGIVIDDIDVFGREKPPTLKNPAITLDGWCKWNIDDKVWWKDTGDEFWKYIISFDKKTELNLLEDYPQKLTAEQKEIFDKEYPEWVDFINFVNM